MFASGVYAASIDQSYSSEVMSRGLGRYSILFVLQEDALTHTFYDCTSMSVDACWAEVGEAHQFQKPSPSRAHLAGNVSACSTEVMTGCRVTQVRVGFHLLEQSNIGFHTFLPFDVTQVRVDFHLLK